VLSHVALQRLAVPARTYTHRRIAQTLETEVESAFSASVMWDCAKHWQLGGDGKRALSLALSCAQHLLDMGLSKEAIDAFERCLPYCTTDSQRLDVLEAEVSVYYGGSNWKRVREVTQLARAVKNRIQSTDDQHDDLELMDLRAQWQSLQWSEIATKALACLHSHNASPRHRAEGGTMALMLVGFQSDTDRLPEIYHQVCDLIDRHRLPDTLRLQADMVFHTEFGDIATAIAAARRLIEAHQAQRNTAELFRAHCNAGVTFRVGGLFNEADESLRKALGLAERYELSASVIRVLPMLGNLSLERGLFAAAREAYERMQSLVIDSANQIATLELGALGARLALIDNDGRKAERLWPLSRRDAIADKVVRRRAYNCALQTAIDLSLTGAPDNATLACLLDACRKSQRGLHQAYNFCIARTALRRIGRLSESDKLYQDYLRNRREPWSVPDHILLAAEALSPSQPEGAPKPQPSFSL
jgi:tetratricopeptide (TPR) repeat protein